MIKIYEVFYMDFENKTKHSYFIDKLDAIAKFDDYAMHEGTKVVNLNAIDYFPSKGPCVELRRYENNEGL